MMKSIQVLLLLLFHAFALQAQHIDSLFDQSLQLIKEDISKSQEKFQEVLALESDLEIQLDYYHRYIGRLYPAGYNEEIIELIDQSQKLPVTNDNYKTHGILYSVKINSFRRLTKKDSSLSSIEKLRELAIKYDDNGLLSRTYYEKAAFLEDDGDLTSALESYLDAIKYAQKSGQPTILATAQLNLALFYETTNKYDLCIEYNKKALETFRKTKKNLPSVARVYNNLGLAYDQLKDHDSAAYFLNAAYRLADSLDLTYGKYITKQNLGLNAYRKKEYSKAIIILEDVLAFFDSKKDGYGMAISNMNLARCYRDSDRNDKALEYALSGFKIAQENNLIHEVRELANDLAEIYAINKDYENAFFYQSQEIIAKDSLLSKDQSYEIGKLESKNELDKREFDNQLKDIQLERQSTQRNALLAGIALLIIILILIYRSQRIKMRTNKELAEKNRLIREAEELKTRWFVNVSHELKTPLTLVQGPISKLLDSDSLMVDQRSDLQMANRNLKQLHELVSEILDFSKLEEGHLELQKSTTDLSQMARTVLASFESLAHQNEVVLKHDIEGEYWIAIDAKKMRKLIQNLISNALKFTHSGGEVLLKISSQKEWLELQVMDSGEGISAEDLPHVFDRFFQSKNKKKSRQGGAGVGLSLAREVAKMHGGDLNAVSSPGKGSTFTLRLPLSLLTDSPPRELDSKQEQLDDSPVIGYTSRLIDKPRLLLAEDNIDMRSYIEGILKEDYDIVLARDGKDALEKLTKQNIDIIISDVMMPRMDGIELIKVVKNDEKWRELPFIILTALNSEEDRIETLRTGIDDYLHKPFNADELKVRAANLIKNRNTRLEESENPIESYDDKLLRTLESEIKTHLTDHFLSVTYLAEKVAMSESSLRRYLKKTTGLSPQGFILELKLQKALSLLEKRAYTTIKEVSAQAGFDRPSRFTSAFEKRFGIKPSEYLSK